MRRRKTIERKLAERKVAVFMTLVMTLTVAPFVRNTFAGTRNVTEDGSGNEIDISITDRIDFQLENADSNTATVSSIQVVNNSSRIPISISNIAAGAASGYTLNAYTSNFSAFPANSKHIGLAYLENTVARDLQSASGYNTSLAIGVSSQDSLSFTGKSSIYSSAIASSSNTRIATITLTINAEEPLCDDGGTLYGKMARASNGSDSSLNFATAPSATNGNGVNTVASTENDTYPVYYYRGVVSDNNVRFAGFCWKAVRTTSTGGVKLIYNGEPSGITCPGTNANIGTSIFSKDVKYNSPAYVGYMYGNNVYTAASRNVRTSGYVFGNDVSWNGTTYTLVDTYTLGTWSSEYQKLAYDSTTGKGYHYTCVSTSTSCNPVYYLNYMTSSASYVISLSGVRDIEAAKTNMFSNDNDSEVKDQIDAWYESHLYLTADEAMLEDTPFCNDRTIFDGLLKSKDSTSAVNASTIYSYFGPYGRNVKNNATTPTQTISPSLSCPNINDTFTVNVANGNGKLDHPIGLLTEDELTLAGHGNSGYSSSSYLSTGSNSWSLSPNYFNGNRAYAFYWNSSSLNSLVHGSLVVRPVVSIAPGTLISDGDGSADRPWTLQ